MKITYDSDLIKVMNLFESLTNARIKDCLIDEERYVFIVEDQDVGKAIGKKGVNIRKLEGLLKKKIKIVGFAEDVKTFIKHLIFPIEAEIEENEHIISLKSRDTKSRGILIGRNARNLKSLKEIVKRHFQFEDIKVI